MRGINEEARNFIGEIIETLSFNEFKSFKKSINLYLSKKEKQLTEKDQDRNKMMSSIEKLINKRNNFNINLNQESVYINAKNIICWNIDKTHLTLWSSDGVNTLELNKILNISKD